VNDNQPILISEGDNDDGGQKSGGTSMTSILMKK